MAHVASFRKNRLFDPISGVLPPSGPHPPRAAFRLGRRAGLLITPVYQRPSARSPHTEFTTGSPEFSNRFWNLLS